MNDRSGVPISTLVFALLIVIIGALLIGFIAHRTFFETKIVLLETEIENSSFEKQALESKIDSLERRISSAEDPWLPDTLVFADLRISLNDSTNWEIRTKLKAKLRYLLHPRNNAELERKLNRMERWFPDIERVADSLEFFEDVKYVFVRESGLDPNAVSPAQAAGISQFKLSTAEDNGLNVRWPVDERFLPEKAIVAGIRHIQDNYDEFGSIALALAAYNKGVDGLRRELERHEGENPGYFDIEIETRRRYETEEFVYWILAESLIDKHRDKYHITYVPQMPEEYPQVVLIDTTLTDRYTDRSAVASFYGMGHPEFRMLNRHLLDRQLPAGDYTFRIPKIYIEQQ